MTDISCREICLDSTWRSFGRSLAAGAGALTALISLLSGVPLATSCGRGALALFGILFLTRLCSGLLARASTEPEPVPEPETSAEDPTKS